MAVAVVKAEMVAKLLPTLLMVLLELQTQAVAEAVRVQEVLVLEMFMLAATERLES